MNILELDSYNLGDAVKFNTQLNPRIWAADETMLPEVRDRLLEIAQDFREFLGITDLQLKDITVSGSNAAYTYTPHSDIDLHLVVDLPEADESEVYRELFDAKKYQYNEQHNIKIGGYDVELYVQDANKPHHSQGIYSVARNEWTDVPKRRKPTVDDISTRSKYEDLSKRIDSAIASNDYDVMTAMTAKIRDMRQAGLDQHGEFGPENLAFKMLRTQGKIKELYDARNTAKDRMLSLDERRNRKKKKRVKYGFGGYWYPGTGYAGQDTAAAQDSGGGDGGGESIREDAAPSDEEILKDFVKFCVAELKIESMPTVKLRRDPQWSVVNRTFGRYINDAHLLEVAFGQRHIMDVLRTVAHELTHAHQHERETVPSDAGETGSPYENEANARAGVLMRDYGQQHPELFDASENELAEGASGYIPTKAQAKDPRFSMALTVDIKPGQLGKEANKLNLKTNKQGIPQIAKANGLFEKLALELVQFKKGMADEDYSPDNPPGPEFKPTMPAGTLKVDVSDVYDWYKLGQHISNMKGLGKHDFGAGPPASIISFGDEDTEHKFIKDLEATGLDVTDIDPVDPKQPKGMRKIKTDPTYNVDETVNAPISKTKDAEQYYRFIVAKAKMGRPLTRGEQDYVKMYQMYRQQKLAESLLNETQTVTRIDSKPVTDFASNLKSYKHTDDWSQSGIDTGDDSYWQKRNIKPKVTKGLYAGEPHRTALYATGNAHETRYVEFTQNGQPIVYFDRKDLPKMRARKTYLTVFDAANFKKLPTGEYFSDNPGQPIKQTEIGDPFQYIAGQGWIVRVTDNLDKVLQQVQAMHKAGKIAQYGAEGMNESVGQDLNEDEQLDEVKMSPSALQSWAKSPAAQGIRAGFEAELIFRDTTNDDDDEGDMEPDYDYDERARSVSQVIDFFNGGDYGGLSDRQEGRLQDGLDEQYMEWQDERMRDAFDEEAEDLIRKVLFDEGDWDEDNEIQKQLALLDLTNDEINDIVNAGERAPKFTSSKEQTAYAEANPLYQKYLDAQAEAEGLLDDLVADEVRKKGANWDAALDDFRENFYVDDDSSFFQDVGLSYMSDIASEYSLDWPYLTGSGGGNNGGSREWDEIGSSLEKTVGMPVKVSSGYHNATRREGQWIVEPDTSLRPDDSEDFGLEIVSPPMPLLQALEQLQAVTDWANSPYGSAYTNDSTGLHMGVSVPYKGGDVDYLKLILFLGDEYVLQSFGREANSYTKSAMSKFRENIKGGRADPAGAMALMKSNLIEFAYREIQKGVGTGKYTSAHIQDGYIEFRSAGGDWLAEGDAEPGKLENTMLRYARAMQIAADPSAERREFAKKLYKLVAPEGDSQLALFSQFAAGEIDKEQLKKQWAEKTIGTERKMNQRWKLYDRATGEPVAGQEYNGYTEDEARARAKGKISPGSSDRDFDRAYELRNIGQDQQWEIYSVDDGETLEIVTGRNKGEAADAVFDKYANQGIGFNVRPYQDPATMTPRAKLAKRITGQPRKPVDYNYEIVNQADVRLPVVDKFYATNDTDAQKVYSQWLKNKDLPDDTADYGYRKVAAKSAEEPPWVAQNFDSARDSATLQTNLQGRAGQDATEVPRNWEFVNRINGQVIHNMTNASYNQANVVQDNLELRYPDADIYLRSVERPN